MPQLLPGGGRDRRHRPRSVHPTRRRALQEPAHRGDRPGEAQVRTGPGARGAPPARSARPPRRRAGRRRGCRSGSRRPRRRRSGCAPCARPPGVERELPTRPEHADAVDHLRRFLTGGTRGEPGDVRAGRDPPPRDLVHVLLRAAGLRMSDVAPVEHQHAQPCELREHRRREGTLPHGHAVSPSTDAAALRSSTSVRDHAERRAGVVGPGDRDLDDRPAVGLDLAEQLDVEGESAGPALREGPGDRVAVEELEPALRVADTVDDRPGQPAEHGAAGPAAQRLAAKQRGTRGVARGDDRRGTLAEQVHRGGQRLQGSRRGRHRRSRRTVTRWSEHRGGPRRPCRGGRTRSR